MMEGHRVEYHCLLADCEWAYSGEVGTPEFVLDAVAELGASEAAFEWAKFRAERVEAAMLAHFAEHDPVEWMRALSSAQAAFRDRNRWVNELSETVRELESRIEEAASQTLAPLKEMLDDRAHMDHALRHCGCLSETAARMCELETCR